MREYQKIETLYTFDNLKKRFVAKFYNPIVEYLAPLGWFATEKVDGTNVRVQWNGHSFCFMGRTDQSVLPNEINSLLGETFNKNEMEVAFEQKFGGKEVILFLEGFGGKIQNGAYTIKKERIIGFDIMIDGIYLDRVVAFAIFQSFGIDVVPQMSFPSLYSAIEYVKKAPKSKIDETSIIEGLVVVPQRRIYDHMGNRIIVKIKVKDLDKLENKGE